MAFNNKLLPWQWGKKQIPVRHEDGPYAASSLSTLNQEMNRLFDEFHKSFSLWPSGFETGAGFQPKIDLSEADAALKLTAELPGMNENEIEVSISKDSLTISGEKREERESNASGFYQLERSYGQFHRVVWLPCEVDSDRVNASFKNGVLTVDMPKASPADREQKRINIKSS